MEFFTKLFDTSDFPARWTCGRWTPGHGWLHILSDIGIWSAYFAIPFALAFFLVRRRDLPFRKLLALFLTFILLCGTTHLMEAVIFWWPAYRLAGVVKLLTAVVSWTTVFALIRMAPMILAMRTPEELEQEIVARTDAERRLQEANADLERRVEDRTAELSRTVAAQRASEERFRQLADAMPQIVWTARPEGVIDYSNRRWFEYTGSSERIGNEEWGKIVHPDDLPTASRRWAESIQTGAAFEMEIRLMDRHTRGYRWHLIRTVPVRNEAGEIAHWYGTATDIHQQKRSGDAARFLAHASASLAALVDEDSTLQKVASLAVPFFADWATVDLAEGDGTLRRVAVAHVDPSKVELAREVHRRFPPDPTTPHGVWNILRTGTSEMVTEITDSLLDDRFASPPPVGWTVIRLLA